MLLHLHHSHKVYKFKPDHTTIDHTPSLFELLSDSLHLASSFVHFLFSSFIIGSERFEHVRFHLHVLYGGSAVYKLSLQVTDQLESGSDGVCVVRCGGAITQRLLI